MDCRPGSVLVAVRRNIVGGYSILTIIGAIVVIIVVLKVLGLM
jgi:hypothetical protein